MTVPDIEPLGDQAFLLRWGDIADVDVNQQVHAFARRLRAANPIWLIDSVPAYASLAIFFDAAALNGDEPTVIVRDSLATLIEQFDAWAESSEARLVEIPVCYGGDFGPDLADVASACGLSESDVVARHSGSEYRVAMLGFSPGFPYLLGLDPALAVPRLSTPRLRVPAGSVGIGGAQTGIYPDEGPGGWRLIGQTPWSLFDARRDTPARILPGDRVRFMPIEGKRFDALRAAQA